MENIHIFNLMEQFMLKVVVVKEPIKLKQMVLSIIKLTEYLVVIMMVVVMVVVELLGMDVVKVVEEQVDIMVED